MTDKSSFGYRHLQTRGWSEGVGLGKKNTGNKDTIKVNLKHDTAGLGHDRGKDFTNQWWDHVFNKAAAKVSVTADGDEVKVKSQELSEESKTKLKEKTLYGNFVKSATLEQGKETHDESDNDESDDNTKPVIPILTDEQLLKACGGRTAHKGARHGFKMNGKLARVEEQDMCTSNVVSSNDSDSSGSSAQRSPKPKKKKRKRTRDASPVVEEIEAAEIKRVKKKKKDRKQKLEIITPDAEIDVSKPKVRKQKKRNDTLDLDDITQSVEVKEVREKKKKKKDKSRRKEHVS